MKQDQVCSKCGAKLSPDAAPQGLCPQCLLKLGLESQGKEPATAPWIEALRSPKGELQTPSAIGPYRILEMLGEGGMGIVYLAEQVEPIRRRVALKIIKPGMDSREILARFDAERQALALMNHSNVAKVFDAGVTEQGRSTRTRARISNSIGHVELHVFRYPRPWIVPNGSSSRATGGGAPTGGTRNRCFLEPKEEFLAFIGAHFSENSWRSRAGQPPRESSWQLARLPDTIPNKFD